MFGTYVMFSFGMGVSAWITPGPHLRRRRMSRWGVMLTWIAATTWALFHEPSARGWFVILMFGFWNLIFTLIQTYQAARWSKPFESVCALCVLMVSPVAWAMLMFFWPYLDGPGFFLGLVLPFKTTYFRETTQAFCVGVSLYGLLLALGEWSAMKPRSIDDPIKLPSDPAPPAEQCPLPPIQSPKT